MNNYKVEEIKVGGLTKYKVKKKERKFVFFYKWKYASYCHSPVIFNTLEQAEKVISRDKSCQEESENELYYFDNWY